MCLLQVLSPTPRHTPKKTAEHRDTAQGRGDHTAHTHTHTHMHAHARMHTHTHMHAHACMHIRTHMHACTHAHTAGTVGGVP